MYLYMALRSEKEHLVSANCPAHVSQIFQVLNLIDWPVIKEKYILNGSEFGFHFGYPLKSQFNSI